MAMLHSPPPQVNGPLLSGLHFLHGEAATCQGHLPSLFCDLLPGSPPQHRQAGGALLVFEVLTREWRATAKMSRSWGFHKMA